MSGTRAFTLIELLVTVCIVSVMALLTITGAKRYYGTAQLVSCSNNLRSLGQGALMYNADQQNLLPWYSSNLYWWQTIAEYLGTNSKVLRCPADKAFTTDDIGRTVSYGWNYTLTGRGKVEDANPADYVKIVAYSKPSTVLIAADGPGGTASQQGDSWGYLDPTAEHTPDRGRHFGKANGLFLDGHVERLDATNFINNQTYFVRTNNP